MSGDLVPEHESALHDQMNGVDVFGRRRVSKRLVRRAQRQVEDELIEEIKFNRAKNAAVAGMIAESELRNLTRAIASDDPAALMDTDDYIRAIHALAVQRVYRAGR